MQYQIIKGMMGSSVKYACAKCKTDLRSPLTDAGKRDNCPTCGELFTVPGVRELELQQRTQTKGKRQKADAKEQKRREQAELTRQASEATTHAKAEQQRKEQEEFTPAQAKAKQIARELQNAMHSTNPDIAQHDWSTGGPWVYDCVEMGTLSSNWRDSLTYVINNMAKHGWEYYRSESLIASRPAGCLSFLGIGSERFYVVVLVFRRPSDVVRAENAVRAKYK